MQVVAIGLPVIIALRGFGSIVDDPWACSRVNVKLCKTLHNFVALHTFDTPERVLIRLNLV